jgi:hypothetical protein
MQEIWVKAFKFWVVQRKKSSKEKGIKHKQAKFGEEIG